METTNYFAASIIPTIVFGLSLYFGCNPKPEKYKPSMSKTIWSLLGIAVGVFMSVLALVGFDIFTIGSISLALYVYGIIILGWSFYAYSTSPSHLSYFRKFWKIVIYILITIFYLLTLFIICIPSDEVSLTSETINIFICLLMIVLVVVAYFSGCLDRKYRKKTQLKNEEY